MPQLTQKKKDHYIYRMSRQSLMTAAGRCKPSAAEMCKTWQASANLDKDTPWLAAVANALPKVTGFFLLLLVCTASLKLQHLQQDAWQSYSKHDRL
jgi:hypothetical protein